MSSVLPPLPIWIKVNALIARGEKDCVCSCVHAQKLTPDHPPPEAEVIGPAGYLGRVPRTDMVKARFSRRRVAGCSFGSVLWARVERDCRVGAALWTALTTISNRVRLFWRNPEAAANHHAVIGGRLQCFFQHCASGLIRCDHASVALPSAFSDLCNRDGNAGIDLVRIEAGRQGRGSEKSTVSGFWPTNSIRVNYFLRSLVIERLAALDLARIVPRASRAACCSVRAIKVLCSKVSADH